MRIQCRTLFDCTHTGVTGTFKSGQLPFKDASGADITDLATWTRARNQQRNWETIMQIVSLRAQPTVNLYPVNKHGRWRFVFEVDAIGVYSGTGNIDDYGMLLAECQGVPMILNLGEEYQLEPRLIVHGSEQNIWFETVNN